MHACRMTTFMHACIIRICALNRAHGENSLRTINIPKVCKSDVELVGADMRRANTPLLTLLREKINAVCEACIPGSTAYFYRWFNVPYVQILFYGVYSKHDSKCCFLRYGKWSPMPCSFFHHYPLTSIQEKGYQLV